MVSKSMALLIANVAAVVCFLCAAHLTWTVECAITNDRNCNAGLVMLISATVFAVADSVWIVAALVSLVKASDWKPIILIIISAIFWWSAVAYDRYRFGAEVENARKA
jgi:hypothetical protein